MSKLTDARDGAPSRRALMQASAACAVSLPVPDGSLDPGRIIAERWRALETEQHRLILAWQDCETWLFKNRDWPKLSEAERAAVPEGAQLGLIDDKLAAIDKSYDALLPLLKSTSATTRAGVLARFDALLWFLDSTDHPHARALLKSCRRDLKRLWI